MRIVTFYSFKGGVGRSLAMVNVAFELVQSGRRVLLVDFDLEAPGLPTFEALRPSEPSPGIVDFVGDYVAAMTAPDVRDYIYESVGVGKKGGRLWVMPAGRSDRAYEGKLAKLDWKSLYARQEGFLLFEDLKAQWRETLKPDYVLIDSRTGHTDIQGICTRQLPDAVVILFFPNQQNLTGLEGVVNDIRAEAEPPNNKNISLYFVMSNVPDLDDEEEILKRRIDEFRAKLRFKDMSAKIHRYDSLSLVNQVVFTRERPNSRLAKEYRKLKDALVEDNVEDRDGAILFLERTLRRLHRMRGPADPDQFEKLCQRIGESHLGDGEVLFLLGQVRERAGRREEALLLYDQALETSTLPEKFRSTALLERGDLRSRQGESVSARADIMAALNAAHAENLDIVRAVRLLREVSPQDFWVVAASPAVRQLTIGGIASIAREFSWERSGQSAAANLLKSRIADLNISVNDRNTARHELSLALIGLGEFEEACEILQLIIRDSDELPHQFNLGMATWGLTGAPNKAIFERVLQMAKGYGDGQVNANYQQCLAVASWATDQSINATERISRAEELTKERKSPSFSCWRYLMVKPNEFLEDCAAIRRLIQGEDVVPDFIRCSKQFLPDAVKT